jgi:hypothetical protein
MDFQNASLGHVFGSMQQSSMVMNLHWKPTQHFLTFWMLIWQHDHRQLHGAKLPPRSIMPEHSP